jgi:hypothetical protein
MYTDNKIYLYFVICVVVFDPPGLAAAGSGKARVHEPCCFHKYHLPPLRPFPTFCRPFPVSSLSLIHATLDPSYLGSLEPPLGRSGLALAEDHEWGPRCSYDIAAPACISRLVCVLVIRTVEFCCSSTIKKRIHKHC